jgi:hypothetical protein
VAWWVHWRSLKGAISDLKDAKNFAEQAKGKIAS